MSLCYVEDTAKVELVVPLKTVNQVFRKRKIEDEVLADMLGNAITASAIPGVQIENEHWYSGIVLEICVPFATIAETTKTAQEVVNIELGKLLGQPLEKGSKSETWVKPRN